MPLDDISKCSPNLYDSTSSNRVIKECIQLNIENGHLHSWLYNQRDKYEKGKLNHSGINLLAKLDVSWQGMHPFEPAKRDLVVEAAEFFEPKDDMSEAAKSLLKLSADSLNDETLNVGDCLPKYHERITKNKPIDFDENILPFCKACKSCKNKQDHHTLCHKNPSFKREKYEKIMKGVKVGCLICTKELRFGCHKGRNDKHSTLCSRSKQYSSPSRKKVTDKLSSKITNICRPVSPTTTLDANATSSNSSQAQKEKNKIKMPPKKRQLVDVNDSTIGEPPLSEITFRSSNSGFRSHEVSPLITVDTYDLDAIISDLKKDVIDKEEALIRLEKIRRFAL